MNEFSLIVTGLLVGVSLIAANGALATGRRSIDLSHSTVYRVLALISGEPGFAQKKWTAIGVSNCKFEVSLG